MSLLPMQRAGEDCVWIIPEIHMDVCKCRIDWCKGGSTNVLESGLMDLVCWADGIGI